MNTMVQCQECGVWIPEAESRSTNQIDPLLTVNFWPEHWRNCIDKQACVRRQKDGVGTGTAIPNR